jgi:DNA primase large subunit
MSVAELRKNDMMAHLLDALSQGQDIGHYGRLVFVMVARHFLSQDELFKQLELDPGLDEEKARALIEQVSTKGYSPPSREKVLEFQKQQQFPICPNSKDPDACNVYKDLKFPPEVYESITEYHEEKAEAAD